MLSCATDSLLRSGTSALLALAFGACQGGQTGIPVRVEPRLTYIGTFEVEGTLPGESAGWCEELSPEHAVELGLTPSEPCWVMPSDCTQSLTWEFAEPLPDDYDPTSVEFLGENDPYRHMVVSRFVTLSGLSCTVGNEHPTIVALTGHYAVQDFLRTAGPQQWDWYLDEHDREWQYWFRADDGQLEVTIGGAEPIGLIGAQPTRRL